VVAQPPASTPIEHVIIIVKENRTYDALFGGFPESAGVGRAGLPSCSAFGEVPHGREVALDQTTHRDCRDAPDQVAVYHALARRYALCARFFSEVRGPSFPNHLMLLSGQEPEDDDPADPPQGWRCPKYCYDFPTLVEQVEASGRTWRSYDKTDFVSSFAMMRRLANSPNVVHWDRFLPDARAGRLPHLSYVFSDAAESEHPPNDLCRGQAWTLKLLEALAKGPQWNRSAVFVVWDDWGGFRDHVDPPIIESDAKGRPLRLGHRVPCIAVGPYVKRAYLSMQRHSHLSLIRFAENVFRLPPLNERVAMASDLMDCFDFKAAPSPPDLPPPPPCAYAHPTRSAAPKAAKP